MKEAKKRADRKRMVYEHMSKDFSESIKHQAELLKQITSNQISDNATTIICDRTELIERLADMLEENANLRRQLAAEQVHVKQHRKSATGRKTHMQLIDKIMDELKKSKTNGCPVHDQSTSSPDDSGEIVIYQRTDCMSCRMRRSNSF